jgi:hypothetical protein
MKKREVRNFNMGSSAGKTPMHGGRQHGFTSMELSGIPLERQQELTAYIRNAERGRLPMIHDGREVTRAITAVQVAKFRACPSCQAKAVVAFPFKGETVGVCRGCWERLASSVVGWGRVCGE